MENKYIVKEGKILRFGYTTGSCAAAAAKAAVLMLFEQNIIKSVKIDTPRGWELDLEIADVYLTENSAKCSVIKDAGDDPDCTDGLKIYAEVKKNGSPGIIVKGGRGIGTVTKRGLQVPAGSTAINPVPMKMLTGEVKKILPEGAGVIIEISAPDALELAKRTFNPGLGIVDGISILGTTGIVEPMSEDAYKESLAIKLSMLKEEGIKSCVFTFGYSGEKFLSDYPGINGSRIVITSNFIGYMLDMALFYKMKGILIAGNIGKLIKLAGGIFQTHSKIADARKEILASHYCYFSGDINGFRKIMESNTTEEAIEYIGDIKFFEYLAGIIKERCERFVHNETCVEVIILSRDKGVLSGSAGAEKLLEEMN